MLFDLEFFIVLVMFVFSLVLVLEPVKGKGIVHLIVGFPTIIMASTVALGFTGETGLVEQLFMVVVDLVAVYCVLRADGISKV